VVLFQQTPLLGFVRFMYICLGVRVFYSILKDPKKLNDENKFPNRLSSRLSSYLLLFAGRIVFLKFKQICLFCLNLVCVSYAISNVSTLVFVPFGS